MESNDLSSSLEDYLEAIYLLTRQKPFAHAHKIADFLHVGKSSVSWALKQLSKKNLVDYTPYEAITLTDKGRVLAERVARRHRQIKSFLTDVLAVDERTAEQDACRLEHILDRDILRRMKQFMVFLRQCPRAGTGWMESFSHFCRQGQDPQLCPQCVSQCLVNLTPTANVAADADKAHLAKRANGGQADLEAETNGQEANLEGRRGADWSSEGGRGEGEAAGEGKVQRGEVLMPRHGVELHEEAAGDAEIRRSEWGQGEQEVAGGEKVQVGGGARPGERERTIIQHLAEVLAEYGRGFSPAERTIAEMFLRSRNHQTVKSLYEQARQVDPGVTRQAVAATLALLCEHKIARAVRFQDDVLYERFHPDSHHDHMYCVRCGAIVEFFDPRIERLQVEDARRADFRLLMHQLNIYGLCRACIRQQAETRSLTQCLDGERVRVVQIVAEAETQERITAMGLGAGTVAQVLTTDCCGDHVIVIARGVRVTLDAESAAKVRVVPACDGAVDAVPRRGRRRYGIGPPVRGAGGPGSAGRAGTGYQGQERPRRGG